MSGQYAFDFVDIFEKPGPLTVAYGMGTDSTALLVEMVTRGFRPHLITIADTGSEHPRTYAYLPIINAYLASHGFPRVTVVRYVPQRFKNTPYTTLAGNCLSNTTLPSLAFGRKSCSLKWKAAPQERFILKHWQLGKNAAAQGIPIRRLIGYDAGVKDNKRGAVKPNDHFLYAYPLQAWGIDRQGCMAIIERAGLPQPGKSACTFCPSVQPEELRSLAIEYPDLAARAVAMEDRAQPNLTKITGLWRCGTRTKPGRWRDFLESRSLMPELHPEHYREHKHAALPVPSRIETYPYLHVSHYDTGENGTPISIPADTSARHKTITKENS